MTQQICANCRHYFKMPQVNQMHTRNICRRYPPRAPEQMPEPWSYPSNTLTHPIVGDTWTCGEWHAHPHPHADKAA